MEITLKHQPAYTLAIARLAGNETVRVEPGAMVSMSEGMNIETKAEGGLFGGLKRAVAGESFLEYLRGSGAGRRNHPRPGNPRRYDRR